MFGLFLYVCFTFQPCQYEPQGYIYPDKSNCLADIQKERLPTEYVCLPVDGVLMARTRQ
ncbi:Uncharacterised protein [Yersinia aldovae]|uniref:DUF1482 family protein n=1 Tax=Yersinia aldovae TaxID=29483 RepID=A0ABP1YRD9_YERAL|nr:Uncharacterised protein [Yersinia aldovae]